MEKWEKGIEKSWNSKRRTGNQKRKCTTKNTIGTKGRITVRWKEMNDTRSKKGMKNAKEKDVANEYWAINIIASAIQKIGQ